MRVLVACEFSGIVREAFRARGHNAWSCDLCFAEDCGPHIRGDVLEHLGDGWDLMVAHPPCTDLAVSGAAWSKRKGAKRQERALDFVRRLMDAPIEKIAVENPVSVISTRIRKPDQVIQPWQFGHPETKATCLWLKGLSPLKPTKEVEPDYMRREDGSYYRDSKGKRYSRIHCMSGRKSGRGRLRSKTYSGVAAAMAEQWG